MPPPQLCKDSQGFFGSNIIICLQHTVQEVLDGAVELLITVLLVGCFDICKGKVVCVYIFLGVQ